MTLVELLVSLVLASLIVLATLALHATSTAAYRTTDANQLLQDNARFLAEVLGQAVRQAGLQDAAQYALFSMQNIPVLAPAPVWDGSAFGMQPALFGYDDGKVASTRDRDDFGASNRGAPGTSDIFGVRYFGSSTSVDAAKADGSVIDCRGIGVPYPRDRSEIGLSLFMVTVDGTGEPTLSCINRRRQQTWPLVSGVESFQVVYGVDADPGSDSSPNRWLHAAQVDAGSLWPRVRAVRFGFVLRGPAGSGVNLPAPQALYPLGEAFSLEGGKPPEEAGLKFTPAADGRLRRAFSFTVAARNAVGQ